MSMDEIDDRLAAAPTQAQPPQHVRARVLSRISRRTLPVWAQAAAAVIIFIAGAVAGRASLTPAAQSGPSQASTGLAVAADVQSAGSAYLAALAHLRSLPEDQELARMQGYEVALGVVAVTAEELSTAFGTPTGGTLAAAAHAARATASQRVTALIDRSDP